MPDSCGPAASSTGTRTIGVNGAITRERAIKEAFESLRAVSSFPATPTVSQSRVPGNSGSPFIASPSVSPFSSPTGRKAAIQNAARTPSQPVRPKLVSRGCQTTPSFAIVAAKAKVIEISSESEDELLVVSSTNPADPEDRRRPVVIVIDSSDDDEDFAQFMPGVFPPSIADSEIETVLTPVRESSPVWDSSQGPPPGQRPRRHPFRAMATPTRPAEQVTSPSSAGFRWSSSSDKVRTFTQIEADVDSDE